MPSVQNIAFARPGSPQSGPSTSIAAFERPNNTTAYTAGDVIQTADANSWLLFPGVGRQGLIRGVTMCSDANIGAITLLLFDGAPAGQTDNAPLTGMTDDNLRTFIKAYSMVPTGIAASFTGANEFTWYTPTGPVADYDEMCCAYTADNSNLYGLLIASGGTPIGNQRFVVRLHLERGARER